MNGAGFKKLIRYQRLIKFCIVGGASTIVALVTLWFLTDVVGIHYLVSNIVALFVGTVIWFVGNAIWTFRDRETNGWSVPKTVITRGATIGVNEGLLALFVGVFGIWYIAGAVLATLTGFMLSYALSNWWVWNYEQGHLIKTH